MKMTIPRLTKQSEERISAALAQVADRTNAGESPDDAIVKVASEKRIPAGHVRLMVRAFNNGRVLGHIKKHAELQERAASVPLADACSILERMFPTKHETAAEKAAAVAVADDYHMSPVGWLKRRARATARVGLEKAAAAREDEPKVEPYPEDPRRLGKKAVCAICETRKEHARHKDAAISAGYKVANAMDAIHDCFRQHGMPSISEVWHNCKIALGERGGKLVKKATKDYLWATVPPKKPTHAVDWAQEPYSLVKAALDAVDEFAEKRAALEQFEQELPGKREEILRPFSDSLGADVIVGSVWDSQSRTKQATGILSLGLAGAIGGSARGFANKIQPKSREELIEDRLKELGEGDHEDKLRAIRTQTMVHELLAADPVISGYDPDMVMDAFNHLAEVAPRAMQQRVMAQALIRKYLEQASAMDPFDLGQLAEMESKTQERDMPAGLTGSHNVGAGTREMGPGTFKPSGATQQTRMEGGGGPSLSRPAGVGVADVLTSPLAGPPKPPGGSK
jgi:hypothetical protein